MQTLLRFGHQPDPFCSGVISPVSARGRNSVAMGRRHRQDRGHSKQTGGNAMRFSAVVVALAAAVSAATQAFAQDWGPMTSKEDGFRAAYPGPPKVETIRYTSEFQLTLPARVYRAADALGRYSTTV